MTITEGGKPGGGGKGQTATKNREETMYLKDFSKKLEVPHGM